MVNLEELWLGKNKLTKLEVWYIAFSLSELKVVYNQNLSKTEQTEDIVPSV